MKHYKYLLIAIFLVTFLLPAVQKAVRFFPEQKFALVKVAEGMDLPAFSLASFIENRYQDSVGNWFNFTTGFKPLLVRMRNQIDYSCFHLTHGKILYGKNHCLFLDENTDGFLGLNLDSALFSRRMDSLGLLKDYLSARGIPMLYVAAPGKANYYASSLPNEYVAMKSPTTYYSLLLPSLKAHGINYIDLHAYFDRPGGHYTYPIFPKQGLHWSVYGADLGLDTIYNKIAEVLKFEPVKIDLRLDTISDRLRSPDDDLAEMINMFSIQSVDTLAYPCPICTAANLVRTKKPKVLFIGDSFTYIFGFNSLPGQLFQADSKYWFYMRTEKNMNAVFKEGVDISEIGWRAELSMFDMVIILSTEGRYDYGDYGLYSRLIDNKSNQIF